MQIKYGNEVFQVNPGKNNRLKGEIDGQPYEIDVHKINENEYVVFYSGKRYRVLKSSEIPESGETALVVNGRKVSLEITSDKELLLRQLGVAGSTQQKAAELKAPMPGLVTRILVKEGQEVEKGTPLLAIEAMKMENVIKASAPGVVSSILVSQGRAVEKNEILIRFS